MRTSNKPIAVVVFFCILVFLCNICCAEVPKTLNFQGRLLDKDKNPLSGDYAMKFSVFDASTGGTALWSETQTVKAIDGIYDCQLGQITALNLNFDKPYYLEVAVSNQVLSPRQKLSSSAYSLNSERLGGILSSSFVKTDSSGNVGIGTTAPKAKLDVQGQIIGGFGARTTAGVKDWNDSSNVQSGSGYTLLLGSAANGPGPGLYFHPFNFEYGSKNGQGNMTQFAIPYGLASHCKEVYYRGRYNGVWSTWRKIVTEIDGKVGIGTASPTSKLQVVGIPQYADNAAAKKAGLTSGAFYRTGDVLKVVHD